MKYILAITLLFIFGACEKEINNAPPIKGNFSCEKAYEFKHSTGDDLPASCHTVSDKECCLWKLDSKTYYEMCLDQYCIWEPKD